MITWLLDRLPVSSAEYNAMTQAAMLLGIYPKSEWPRRKRYTYCRDMMLLVMNRSPQP